MWRAWAFPSAALASGCSHASSEQNPNELDGFASFLGGNDPSPKTTPPTELIHFKNKLKTYLHSGARPGSPRPALRASLNRAFFETLKPQEGFHRWQLRPILQDFLSPDNTACGGTGCARVFDRNAHGVDNYPDSLYKAIQRTSRPRSAALEKLCDIPLSEASSVTTHCRAMDQAVIPSDSNVVLSRATTWR